MVAFTQNDFVCNAVGFIMEGHNNYLYLLTHTVQFGLQARVCLVTKYPMAKKIEYYKCNAKAIQMEVNNLCLHLLGEQGVIQGYPQIYSACVD